MCLPQERTTGDQVFYTWVARSRSGSSSFTALAPEKVYLLSPRTCTAGIVALTPARCLLAEADTAARNNCAVAWRDRGESPSGT